MRQLTVAEDPGIGMVGLQRLQQMPEGSLLLSGARVGRMFQLVQASLVAYADGVLVIASGMGADEVFMTGLVDVSITGDIVMIPREAETVFMVGNEPFDGVRAVAARGTAVDDDEIDASHLLN